MAYSSASAITDITNVSLGQIAQILFSKGFTSQMNRSYADFDNVLLSMMQNQATTEREYRFLLQTALGVNAIEWQNQGATNVAFPAGDNITTQEATAVMKVMRATIELDRNIWERIRLAQAKYVDNPLAMEIESKLVAAKKNAARQLFGDGSGALGVVGSVSISGGKLVVVLSTADASIGGGNTNWFEKGQKIAFCTSAGAAQVADSAGGHDIVFFSVDSVVRSTRTITLSGFKSGATSSTAITAANDVGAADLIYPVNVLNSSLEGPDLTAGGLEWGTVSPVMAGLESLAANDGRKVHGITMSGLTAGSRFDAGGNLFDVTAIEESMNECVQNVGEGIFKYDQLLMPYNAYSALLEGKEADRRFNSVEDSVRGGRKFIYQYSDQALDCRKSHFCPFNRIYSIPKPAAGEMGESGYAIELRGTQFNDVSVGGNKEFMKISNGQYVNVVQSFLEAYMTLVVKRPAAINVVHNFVMA